MAVLRVLPPDHVDHQRWIIAAGKKNARGVVRHHMAPADFYISPIPPWVYGWGVKGQLSEKAMCNARTVTLNVHFRAQVSTWLNDYAIAPNTNIGVVALGRDAATSIAARVDPSEQIAHWQSAPARASAPHQEHLQQLL
jgi:hypothetical protein